MNSELRGRFFLSAGDCNAQGRLSLPVLTSNIIEIATAHANSLGIGNPSMESLGYGWVLSRLAIEMERYPEVNQEYFVTTWIESFNRHFSVRNFRIDDYEGNAAGYATSVWMVLNWKSRENAGTSHLSLEESLISGKTVPIEKFGKHRPIVISGEEIHNNALIATSEPIERTFRYTDLDFYRHVNTIRYVSMLLDCFSLRQMDETEVRRLELAFLREGHYGERIRILKAEDGLHTSFAVGDVEDGTGLLSASLWRRATAFS